MSASATAAARPTPEQPAAAMRVLGAVSASHLINDMMQSLILAIYPVLQGRFSLTFTQIGIITLTYQLTASLFQPVIGTFTDRKPRPYSLPLGMTSTLCGLLLLAYASSYARCCSRPRWSGWARRCSIPSRRASRAWPRAAATASHNRFSRSAATPAARSARWSRRW